jgi:excisionase family DNA binding protein
MEKLHLTTEDLRAIRHEIKDIFEAGIERFIKKDTKEQIYLSRKDTAEQLCVSLPTLHDWTKTGIIKAYRIGGRVLYKLSEIHDACIEVRTSNLRGGQSC